MKSAHDERLVDTFVEAAQLGLGSISQTQLDDGWDRLERATTAPPPRRAVARRWRLGLATAGALTALALTAWAVLVPRRPALPLRYVIEGVASSSGSQVSSLPGQPARLRFSDDSSVTLGPSTRLDVGAMGADGARIVLVDGTVDVYVKERARTSWRFAAGPFEVRVKGTAFGLTFEAGTGRLNLRMTSGLVEVLVPPDRSVAVAAGESLELDGSSDATEPPAVPAPPSKARADQPAEPHADGVTEPAPLPARNQPPRAAVRRPPPPSERPEPAAAPIAWSGLLAQGDFAGVVADAERRGLDAAVAQASAAELASLADAARYTKRPQLAQKVLLSLRARFPGSDPARDASFFLGRLAETASGNAEGALAWYDTYLREAPRGLYAAETLGREMTLLSASSPPRARRIARTYLERFPHGPQAGLARSLLESE
jgi:hypothetical protein